jgi:hypothetical protein
MAICRVVVQVAGSAGTWTTSVGREYDEYDEGTTFTRQIKAPQGQNSSTHPSCNSFPLLEGVQTRATRSSHAYRFQQPQVVCPDLSIMLLTDHLKLAWRCERGLILQSCRMQHPMGQTVVEPRVPTRSIGCPNGLTPDRTLGRSRNSVARLSAITSFVWNDG